MTYSISKLNDTINRICEFVENLPDERQIEGEWGPKSVLSHLVYHHQVYVDQIEGIIEGVTIVPPAGTFAELNAIAVEKYSQYSVHDLMDRFKDLNQRLVSQYYACNPKEVRIEIKVGSKLRSFEELIPEVEAHIRNHQLKLQR